MRVLNSGSFTGGVASRGTGDIGDALAFTSGINQLITITGGSCNGSISVAAGATLSLDQSTINTGNSFTYVNSFRGAGDINVQTDGNQFVGLTGVNTYTGATTISAGTLQLGDGGETGSIAGTSSITNNGILAVNHSNAITLDKVISGTGTLQQIGTGTTTLTGANTYTGATTISAGTLQLGNGISNGTLANTSGISVAAGAKLAFKQATAVTVSKVISGDGALTQNGPGTVTLSDTNTYTGGTTLSSGTLSVGADNNLGASTGGLTFTGGTLSTTASFAMARAVAINGGGGTFAEATGTTLTVNGAITGVGRLTKQGSGTLTLAANNTGFTGTTELNGGKFALIDAGSIASSSGISNNGSIFDISGLAGTSTDINNYNGVGQTELGAKTLNVNGSSSFFGTVSGNGGGLTFSRNTFSLNGSNTYTGTTTVSSGNLNILNDTALGTTAGGTIVESGATLYLRNNITVGAEALSLAGNGRGSGALSNGSDTNSFGGTVTLAADARIQSESGTLTLNAANAVTGGFNLTVGGAGNTVIAGTITTGSGTLKKDGAGTLTLSAVDTYTGTTTIAAGTLALSGAGSIAASSTVTDNANFDISGVTAASSSIKSLAGTTVGATVTLGTKTLNLSAAADTFAGKITGTGGLSVAGGTEILTGASDYSGATTVSGGTLLVNGSLAQQSAVTVGVGATLGGSGTIAGTITVGGTISAGLGVGTLATGSLTLSTANGGNPIFHEDVASSTVADRINVTGTVSLAGLLDFSTPTDFAAGIGQNLILIANDVTDAVTGRFTSLRINNAAVDLGANDTFSTQGHTYLIDYSGGDGNDVAIRDVTPAPTPPTQPIQPTQPTQPTGPTPQTANAPAFGGTVTDTASAAGGVYGLYKALLGRAPDPLGLESFTTAIQNGATLTDVANALLGSPEGASAPNAATDPNGFVQSLYQKLLGRVADPSGLQTFTGELAAGISPGTVAVQLATSAEAQSVLAPIFKTGVYVPDASEAGVARLYYGLLGRAPDAGGLQAFSAFVENGGGGAAGEAGRLGQAAAAILTSTEYAGRIPSGSDLAFVNGLYQGALGRSPEAGGAEFYIDQLAHGVSRATVALEIAQSPEAQIHLVGLIEGGFQLAA
ncbi:DUF4214 domain-containing protein [Methylobacterium sp. Leaf99]|uniref:DUF4214 domain-containing protein n=1 Tax=Methylobacterium sp. Leaf99 TaxID=1736251 RepID=UPI00138F0124|nr:DUF4214 domain-containing protein [Methylobacterium sp. Leaf99]